jgi:tetratricopeptide (TPR) repeat protein
VPTAFDLYTDRKVRYRLKDGVPDPATVDDDKRKLTEMVKATMESWHGRKVSPVYNLMPNLQEPEWKALRIGDVREFWEQHEDWESRLDLARKAGNIGNVLVLAEEAPVAAFRAEAWIKAGESLRKVERYQFALEHLERALEIEPENLRALQEKGTCLQRLAVVPDRLDRAREHYRKVLKLYPTDAQTWALLGRVDKDTWIAAWHQPGRSLEQMKEDAAHEDALLRVAIDSSVSGYRVSPDHYYSAINALMLMHLYKYLTKDTRYDRDMATLAGAVRLAAECETRERFFLGAKTTLATLEVLLGTADTVAAACKEIIAEGRRNWFALNSRRDQLQLLQDLGFRPEAVAAGIATFDRALLKKPEDSWQPRQVLLFRGDMIDAPDRETPCFPAAKEDVAAEAISAALDQLNTSSEDLALSQAAAGGDLIFIEACQKRGVRCQVLLPFNEAEFIQRSILPSACGEKWRDRFYALKSKELIRIMPDELGPLPKGVGPFERCNLWLLYSALACGLDKVRFVTLWNGGGEDEPGGAAHMYNEVKRRTGRIEWLDTRRLW